MKRTQCEKLTGKQLFSESAALDETVEAVQHGVDERQNARLVPGSVCRRHPVSYTHLTLPTIYSV